jgi:hypothetical protein
MPTPTGAGVNRWRIEPLADVTVEFEHRVQSCNVHTHVHTFERYGVHNNNRKFRPSSVIHSFPKSDTSEGG